MSEDVDEEEEDAPETDYRESVTFNYEDPKQRAEAYRRVITFKDFKGFKSVTDIHEHYKFYKTLGKGSFGEVLLAEHIRAKV